MNAAAFRPCVHSFGKWVYSDGTLLRLTESMSCLAFPRGLLHGWDDNGFPCAFYYSNQLFLLRPGHVELIERLLKVIQKGLPLLRSDHEMPMGITHGTAAVVVWTTCCPADHF